MQPQPRTLNFHKPKSILHEIPPVDPKFGYKPLVQESPQDLSFQVLSQFENPTSIPKILQSIANSGKPFTEAESRTLIKLKNTYQSSIPIKKHAKFKPFRITLSHKGWVTALCFDPLAEKFASGSNDASIIFWNFKTGKRLLTLAKHVGAVQDLLLSPHHTFLLSAGEDQVTYLWDLTINKISHCFGPAGGGIFSLCFQEQTNDAIFWAGSRDCSIRVYDIRSRKAVSALSGHTGAINSLCSCGSSPFIISGSMDQSIRVWDNRMMKSLKVLTFHSKAVSKVLYDHLSNRVISAGRDAIKYWTMDNFDLLYDLSTHKGHSVRDLSLNNDGVLVSVADDGTMVFHDLDSTKVYQQYRIKPVPGTSDSDLGIQCSRFSPDGEQLLVGCIDKTIRYFKPKLSPKVAH